MNYTVYQVTNQVSDKIYIGVHATSNIDDNYMGSGIHIKRAIDKHGLDNFTKDVLYVFDNKEDAYLKEKEIVTEDFVNRTDTYNLTTGGQGGWLHVDNSGENNPNYGKELWKNVKTSEEILIINAKRASHGEKNGMYGKTHTDDAKERIIQGNKEWLKTDEGKAAKKLQAKNLSKRMKGVPKTEEQKKKMSDAAKARCKNNPVLICPHCQKEGKGNAMKQWHFKNCKTLKIK